MNRWLFSSSSVMRLGIAWTDFRPQFLPTGVVAACFPVYTRSNYAGPRVSEVAALQIPDVQVSARRGLLIIRRGKGLKHREVLLVQEAREPL